jgi:DNA-binding transcriptional ArsR family regulator
MPDRLSATLSALADPTRRAILARLATGEATVNQLAEPFDISLPAISRHLKVLQKAGLIAQGREAQWRPCRITPAPLAEVAGRLGSICCAKIASTSSTAPLSNIASNRRAMRSRSTSRSGSKTSLSIFQLSSMPARGAS